MNIHKLLQIVRNPLMLVPVLGYRGFFRWMPDELFLKISVYANVGYWPDLDNPVTFNEKLQWLKLNNHDPYLTKLVDKYEVKGIVAKLIGEEHIIPTLGVWDKFENINFDILPNQFVLKCTHDSGGLVICKDKASLDQKKAKRKITKCLKRNFFWGSREWPYKNVKPQIIAEKYISESTSEEIKDYKFFCFNGKPEMILVCSERFSETGLKEDFFDIKWNKLPLKRPRHDNSALEIPAPANLDTMLHIAQILSKGISFSRIDLFEVDKHVYFGEITFYPASGFEGFYPSKWDSDLGKKIHLKPE